jgi:hypothetical protein
MEKKLFFKEFFPVIDLTGKFPFPAIAYLHGQVKIPEPAVIFCAHRKTVAGNAMRNLSPGVKQDYSFLKSELWEQSSKVFWEPLAARLAR